MSVLVTGGAGFIGSHTCADLLAHGHDVVVADNLANSYPAALDAVRTVGRGDLAVHVADLRDAAGLDDVFGSHQIDSVVHFAALKSVGESMSLPLDYFDVNVGGTIGLLRAMRRHGVSRLVFSSSCSVYGDQYDRPITEADPPAPVNPYARSKLICEQMLESACAVYPDLSVISLRYFTPAGAHPSGRIGECPRGVPSNVVPYMVAVAAGKQERLPVFGADYGTPDGTAIRDYIHVADVAEAHRLAIGHAGDRPGFRVLNIGTGTGHSVLELIRVFEETCGVRVPFQVTGRRAGDVASLIADPTLADKEWGWRAGRDIAAIFRDAWLFERLNPDGFGGEPGSAEPGA